MSENLRIFLVILLIFFIMLIISRLKHKKLSIRYGVIWIILVVLLILSLLFYNLYFDLAKFLGFEKTSNMVFLFAFFFLFYLNFTLATTVSALNEKVKNLLQEVSILKERVEKMKKK